MLAAENFVPVILFRSKRNWLS